MASTTEVSSLSAGIQQLYNKGFLSGGLSAGVIKNASSQQLAQLANSSTAGQEAATLLGVKSDSSSLSEAANSFLSTNGSTTNDPLASAVEKAILAPGTAAASRYLPQAKTQNGEYINVLG